MKVRVWCHVVVMAASLLLFSSLASAGIVLGEFRVDAEGSYLEDGADFLVNASVVAQDPDLGFDTFDAQFELDEFGDPATFTGFFTLTSEDGELRASAAGAAFTEEAFVGLAGVFEIISGTGVYEGLTGGGVISALGVGDEAGEIFIRLGGVLVPAPAAFALFGAAGLVTRRRRRA